MFAFPLNIWLTIWLIWLHHVGWHTEVKRHRCAVLCRMWFRIVVSYHSCHLRNLKVCSKKVIRYETVRIGSLSSGENVEKTGQFLHEEIEVVYAV